MEEEDSAPLHHVEELIRGNEDTLFEQAAELTNQVQPNWKIQTFWFKLFL